VTRETRPLRTISILAPSHLGFFTKELSMFLRQRWKFFLLLSLVTMNRSTLFHEVLEK